MQDLHERVERLERANSGLRVATGLLLVFGVIAIVIAALPDDPGVVRATEVVIEDSDGVVRARLGGNLPDAEYDGRTLDRGVEAAGLLIYDSTGGERGGYVTFDNGNALLTLDAGRAAGYRQTAYFIADEAGETALRIWNADGDHVEMRGGSGTARFNAVRDSVLEVQLPAMTPTEAGRLCSSLRPLLEEYSREEVFNACTGRATAEVCTRCVAN